MSTERRLHAPNLILSGGELRLGKEAAHHAAVLRLEAGDAVTLFDGAGHRAAAVVVSRAKDEIVLMAEPAQATENSEAAVTLVQGLPRGGKLDDLVRAATELGVAEIRLATTEHSVVRPGDERADKRRDRLERVVREAARQSERDGFPVVHAPQPLAAHAACAAPDAIRLAFCGRSGAPLGRLVSNLPVFVVIGPEGGLSERELETLDGLGYQRVSLGDTILRVETAVVAALAAVEQARRDGDLAANR